MIRVVALAVGLAVTVSGALAQAPLSDRIETLLTARGKKPDFGQFGKVILEDLSDGKGPFIAKWDTGALGAVPKSGDGFSAHELHRSDGSHVKGP